MSWLFSQALVEEYLGGICSDGEPSAQSSGNPMQLAYLPPDKMTDFSRLSRFGMMFKPLTEDRGEELLTSYLAAFHAKTSPQPEREQALTVSDQECGEKWQGSFTKYDPDSCSWKTHQCSLLGDLEPFLETWPRWGLMRDGECWELPMSAHRINVIEFGLEPDNDKFFHTPNTTGMDGGSNSRKALKKRQEIWPTPATKGYGHAAEGMVSNLIEKIENGVITKEEAEAMLSLPKLENHRTWKKKYPTPTSHNAKETNAPSESERNTPTLAAQAGGKLNPMWVEWLMGWPLGWTDLKPLETDKYHLWLQQHGKN
jgi:DNA (cytosine-5)-methyltransferase 1